MIPYSRQHLFPKDIEKVVKVLKSNYLTQGPEVKKLEKKLSNFCKVKFAKVVNSATAALHLTCMSMGLKKNDYLWTVPISFVASSNCGLYCGAKIDFVDINEHTFNIDVDALIKKLRIAKKINKLPKILVIVHLAGNPCNLSKINLLAKKYKFKIIEDASHALGTKYKRSYIGNCRYSDAAVFSFHPVKTITGGEGGAVVCKKKEISQKIEMLREHGITKNQNKFKYNKNLPWYFEQQYLGFNYRMSDINAALINSQIDHIKLFVKKRNHISNIYQKKLEKKNVKFQKIENESISSRHLFIIRVKKKIHKKLFEYLRGKKIYVQIHYIPIYKHPYYKENFQFIAKDFPNSEKYYSEAISIPVFYSLSDKKQTQIINLINSFFK